jgi:hypothetical protein|tara:strand:+ start:612 stop:779 length:168 start_codon:yes stop_codon:yes gene_type:complete
MIDKILETLRVFIWCAVVMPIMAVGEYWRQVAFVAAISFVVSLTVYVMLDSVKRM